MPLSRLIAVCWIAFFGLSGCIHFEVLQARHDAEQLFAEGRTEEIIDLIDKMIVRVEDELGPDHWYLGEGYDTLARLHAYVHNDFELARVYFERALEIRTKALGPEHPDTLETINFTGYLYQVTGDLPRAEAHFRKALTLRTKVLGPDHVDTADSQVYLANLNLLQGRYAEAEALLQEAVKHEARKISGRHPTPGESHALLGSLYYDLGDLPRARRYYGEALAIMEDVFAPGHTELASRYDALARVSFREGKYDEAEKLGNQAFRIYREKFGRNHGFTGDSLRFLGRIEGARGNEGEAREYLSQALDVYETVLGPDNYRTLSGKFSIAWSHARAGEFEQAAALCEEILASPRLPAVKELEWNVLLLYSLMLGRTDRQNTAILFGKRAVNILQGLRAGIASMDEALQKAFVVDRDLAFRNLASLLVEEGRLPEAQQVLRMIKEQEHFEYVRRNAARGPIRETTASYTAPEQSWVSRYEEISDSVAKIGTEYEALLKQKKAGKEPVDESRLERLRDDLKVAKRGFRAFLAELMRELESGSTRRAVEIGRKNLDDLKALQGTLRDLGEGVVLIHYLVTERQLYAIVTTSRVQIVRKVAIERAELNRKVSKLAAAFADYRQDPLPQAKSLYDLIFAPIADDLRQAEARTLMFSLDGVLRYVPMAALHDGRQYVVENYEVVLFTEAAQSKLIRGSARQWSLAGLGLTRAVEGFSPLPAVADELNSIVRTDSADREGVMPGVVYLDESFTEKALVDVLEAEYPVLHVASHFVFEPGTERDSYLLLGDGNILSLAHMLDQDLDFNSVELLTLSACQTALGSTGADGREIEGFGWLAQRQGAKAVLATLWPVADRSTAEFMNSLYGNLQSGAMTKAAAMRNTQIEFIRSDDYGHPSFWAAMILMGNWL